MKMRFWQKTYIFTLILFLFCINIGVLSLTVYTHSKNVQSAEATASAEQYYVAMSFERDYSDLMEMNENASPTLLMQTFGSWIKFPVIAIILQSVVFRPSALPSMTNSALSRRSCGMPFPD